MSKNVSTQLDKRNSRESKKGAASGALKNIPDNLDFKEDVESSMNLRKRSERQASQGVKTLVEREKGNTIEKITVEAPMVLTNTPKTIVQTAAVPQNIPSTILKPESINRGPASNVAGFPTAYPSNLPSYNSIIASNVGYSSYLNPPHQSQPYAQLNMNNSNKSNMISTGNSNLFATLNPHPTPNIPQYILNNPINPNLTANPTGISRQIFNRPHKEDKERILNRYNFEKILIEKVKREGLEVKNLNEILGLVNIGLENYLKNIVEKLISISRARNVNLNLYSKSSEKNPIFKIHSYNLDRHINPNNQVEFTPVPYKDFSLLFTKNTKHTINMLEEYEELSMKKMRQDKMVLYKNKLEEITTQKEKDKSGEKPEKITQSLIVRPRGRKRESSMLKSVRNTLAKSQKKIEMDRQKKDTQNTLETFLDNKPKFRETSSQFRFDTEMASNIVESHNFETYTKLSEVSKSEAPGTVNITAESGSNEINLCVFKSPVPSQNTKIPYSVNIRRRITLKDLIFYLERERNIPFDNIVLYKAMIKLAQFSSN
jgi:hypothetical protein